jgi:DNA-binding beta-propeller fold protein YncE
MSGHAGWLLRAGTCALLTAAAIVSAPPSRAQEAVPKYKVDTSWPRLPPRWVLGGLGGVCVDAQDHVFILNRQDILEGDLNAGEKAPPIIEIDPAGQVVNAWGDADLLDWRLHSCSFDKDNNVWVAAAPSGMVQKYTHDGSKLLFQLGKKGVLDSSDGTEKGKPLNSNAAQFFGPSSIYIDPGNGDIYIADGESNGWNNRVAVMDRNGKFLRQWHPEGMQTVHCMTVADDGLVYICNRQADKIQVYDKRGTLVSTFEVHWKQYTPSPDGKRRPVGGAAVALAFSPDPAQRLIYLINQSSAQVEIIDRKSGKMLSSFGDGVGHYPGQFNQLHAIAVDSKGNVYVAENRGRRVQKFTIVGAQ